MMTTLSRLRPRLRSFVQRVLFVGPRTKGAESGANILINNIVGIIIGVIFLGVGIAVLLNTLDSSRTARAKDTMDRIASEVHDYYLDHGVFPSPGAVADVMTAMPGYFQSAPCDPVDATCNPSSTTASDFSIESGVTSTDASDYVIFDHVPSHAMRTLNGLPKYVGLFAPPTTHCLNSCQYLIYDGIYGFEGS